MRRAQGAAHSPENLTVTMQAARGLPVAGSFKLASYWPFDVSIFWSIEAASTHSRISSTDALETLLTLGRAKSKGTSVPADQVMRTIGNTTRKLGAPSKSALSI